MSRIETGRLEAYPVPCDLVAIAAEVIERLTPEATRRGCTFALQAPASAVGGIWDPDLLDQVLTNLFDNAIRYSPQGGGSM